MEQPKMNVDLSQATDLECTECNNKTFTPGFILKKISALLSPTGKETMVPVQIFECSKCHVVPEQFASAFGPFEGDLTDGE
jgi:hypothetical protein